jgi:hypothetical protein
MGPEIEWQNFYSALQSRKDWISVVAVAVAVAERIVKHQIQRGWLKALTDSGSDLDWERHASICNLLQIDS